MAQRVTFLGRFSFFIQITMVLFLFGCSGASPGAGANLPNGAPSYATSPTYEAGAPVPDTALGEHVLFSKTETFAVKAEFSWTALPDQNGQPNISLNIKGRAFCKPVNGEKDIPCKDGRTVKISDGLQHKFIETFTQTQNGQSGYFEVKFNSINLKQDPKVFLGDIDKYHNFISYAVHLDEGHSPASPNTEKLCVYGENEPDDCPTGLGYGLADDQSDYPGV